MVLTDSYLLLLNIFNCNFPVSVWEAVALWCLLWVGRWHRVR